MTSTRRQGAVEGGGGLTGAVSVGTRVGETLLLAELYIHWCGVCLGPYI